MGYLIVLAGLFSWNFFTFIIMGIDKRRAQRSKHRIAEYKLILYAFFLGSFGIFLGMKFFRHKTRHLKFTIGIPLLMVANILFLAGISKLVIAFQQ